MTSQLNKFLIFRLQSTLYALDLAQVAEVSDPPQLWPIPLAPACYSGVMNFHGDIVAVMNLAFFLGLKKSSNPEKVIMLHREIASLAFLVDAVVRIISEEDVSVTPPPADNAFAAATLLLIDGHALQLDLNTIVTRAEADMLKISRNQNYFLMPKKTLDS